MYRVSIHAHQTNTLVPIDCSRDAKLTDEKGAVDFRYIAEPELRDPFAAGQELVLDMYMSTLSRSNPYSLWPLPP